MEWELYTCVGIGLRQYNGYGSTDNRKSEYRTASKFEVHPCYTVEPSTLEEPKMRFRGGMGDEGEFA